MIQDEERIAHTGALARCAGRCARHPWRVIFSWLGIFVVLIGLNAAFHGKLINDFKIPGSDTQKATDLITAKFGGQKGAALRVVLALEAGQRLDTPQRRRRDPPDAGRRQRPRSATLAEDPNGHRRRSRARSRRARISSPPSGQVAYFDVQYDRPASSCRGRASSRSRISCARSASRPASRSSSPVRRRARRRRRGSATSSGCVAAFVILMVLFRALVPTVIPLLFAITAVLGAFLILFLAARLTHFNTVTEILVPMIGLGRRHRLHALHRHALPTVPA